MLIIPAIDLKDGLCVRLMQGNFGRSTVYSEQPADVAVRWQEYGAKRIHIVDLDGSLAGIPRNREVIRKIIGAISVPIEVGGGIRDMLTIEAYLNMGVKWVILGTAALKDRQFVADACRTFKEHIILGIDANNGQVAVQGWTEQTSASAMDVAQSYEGYGLAAIVYTDIVRDGMETGVNLEATKALAEAIHTPVIASGGVSGISDIEKLLEIEKFGVAGVIIGKALYTGAISLQDAVKRTQ